MHISSVSRQRGLSLIEAVVALVVAALGLMGVAGMQLRTLSDTQTAVRHAQAIRLIEDFSERLSVHPGALSVINGTGTSGYIINAWGQGLSNPAKDCASQNCTANELVAWDIFTWLQQVRNVLPAGDGVVFFTAAENGVAGDRRQLGILIRWRENENANLTADDIKNTDMTLIKDGGGFKSGVGQGNAALAAGCNGYTCHLQYVAVRERCIFHNGNSFFCSD